MRGCGCHWHAPFPRIRHQIHRICHGSQHSPHFVNIFICFFFFGSPLAVAPSLLPPAVRTRKLCQYTINWTVQEFMLALCESEAFLATPAAAPLVSCPACLLCVAGGCGCGGGGSGLWGLKSSIIFIYLLLALWQKHTRLDQAVYHASHIGSDLMALRSFIVTQSGGHNIPILVAQTTTRVAATKTQ